MGEWSGHGLAVDQFQRNLTRCSVKLREWGRNANMHMRSEIHKQRQAIATTYQTMRPLDFKVLHSMESDFAKLLKKRRYIGINALVKIGLNGG